MAFNQYMHERNIYKNPPDFTQIALDFPKFRKYAIPDAKTGKKVYVDFSNPDALRMVTEILLKKDFNLDVVIPQGYLIPTVPQRLNYILWVEDMLNNIPLKKEVASGIDIGTGPCAIFSILGARKNSWNFIATETSDDAIKWAKKNIETNNLEDKIKIVKISPDTTLSEVLCSSNENFDFCLCNPPFFGSIEEIRKKHHNSKETIADVAQKEEIFFDGGELNFVKNILNDSITYKDRISLFTSMFGKKRSFLQILKDIRKIKGAKVTTTEFCQGNTVRWGIAWTFNETIQLETVDKKIKPKKGKPPLEYQIPVKDSKEYNLKVLLQHTKNFIESLLIPVTVTRSSEHFAELHLKSDENTWSNQRRKRREMQRKLKEGGDLKIDTSTTTVNEISKVQGTDSKTIPNPKNSVSAVADESKLHGYATSCKVDLENFSQKIVSSSNCAGETSQEIQSAHNKGNETNSTLISNIADSANNQNESAVNKRKEFSADNSPIHKKHRLNTSLISENSHSEENTNIKLESSESECKEGCVLQTTDALAEIKSDVDENLKTNSQISESKNDTKSLGFKDNKCEEIGEVCSTNKSDSSNNTEMAANFTEIQNKQSENIGVKSLSKCIVGEHFTGKVDHISTQQGSVLDCHLQLIKGKNKVYVKMNCPLSANRNTMYNVFQLIKNKIKQFLL